MIEMTTRTLMKSLYDGDSNLTSLIFEDGTTKVIATGKDLEGSKDDANYFDNEENIKAFLDFCETINVNF